MDDKKRIEALEKRVAELEAQNQRQAEAMAKFLLHLRIDRVIDAKLELDTAMAFLKPTS